MLAPMECYRPSEKPANTCGIGGFGVVDPVTLAWRYWVRLDQADIAKAMWAETAPDGELVWTSSGDDLLAYRSSRRRGRQRRHRARRRRRSTRCGGSPAPSRRRGSPARSSTAGGCCWRGRTGGLLQVWSVDVTGATPAALELELPVSVSAESEGLDVAGDMRGGLLHWLLSPFVAEPTYGSGHSELLTFVPSAYAGLRLRAVRQGRDLVVTVTTMFGPVPGAIVRLGKRNAGAKTVGDRAPRACARCPRARSALRATKLSLRAAKKTVR